MRERELGSSAITAIDCSDRKPLKERDRAYPQPARQRISIRRYVSGQENAIFTRASARADARAQNSSSNKSYAISMGYEFFWRRRMCHAEQMRG